MLSTKVNLKPYVQEIMERCNTLASISEENHQLTRPFLSSAMKEVHRLTTEWMKEAGMQVRVDAISNIIGHYPGVHDQAPVFLIGSHLDTVRNAGKYDGILGVLTGIAAVKALGGKALPFALDIIGFADEEGLRFGSTYFGSQAITGTFDTKQLSLRDAEGVSMHEALEAFGLNPEDIPKAAYNPKKVFGYAEIHIEQGPVLENNSKPIGIVEAVVGQSKLQLSFRGKAGHAGTTPMRLRQDAFVGAAQFALEVETYARSIEGLLATIGKLDMSPNASNVIPGHVSMSLDIRHKDDATRQDAVTTLLSKAQVIANQRKLDYYYKRLLDEPTAWMGKAFTSILANTTKAPLMVSGAGHDAAIMSKFCQTILMFIRSPGGISHHPDERVRPKDVHHALKTFIEFLQHLELSHAV